MKVLVEHAGDMDSHIRKLRKSMMTTELDEAKFKLQDELKKKGKELKAEHEKKVQKQVQEIQEKYARMLNA